MRKYDPLKENGVLRFYSVELRHPDTGYWFVVKFFRPEFETKMRLIKKRFLWWVLEKPEEYIVDQVEVENKLRVMAIRATRRYWPGRDVRVMNSYWSRFLSISYMDDLIWQNGEFKDC